MLTEADRTRQMDELDARLDKRRRARLKAEHFLEGVHTLADELGVELDIGGYEYEESLTVDGETFDIEGGLSELAEDSKPAAYGPQTESDALMSDMMNTLFSQWRASQLNQIEKRSAFLQVFTGDVPVSKEARGDANGTD